MVVGCRWVYKIKTKSNGSVDRYKAHLVAKKFTQKVGFDYEKTFGPVAKMKSIHDMILTGDDTDEIVELKSKLHHHFEMKDLGPLKYFISIEVAYSPKGYLLSQSKYVADVIQKTRLTDTRTIETPLELNVHYTSSNGVPLADPTLYSIIVGNLVYLSITRPDIIYVVHIVSQFISSPNTIYWDVILRILHYIKGTLYWSILLPSTSTLELRAYSDVDWAGDPTDRKFTTGFYIFPSDSLISWKIKKQSVVSCSFTEAEYRVMTSTIAEIVWLHDYGLLILLDANSSDATHITVQLYVETIPQIGVVKDRQTKTPAKHVAKVEEYTQQTHHYKMTTCSMDEQHRISKFGGTTTVDLNEGPGSSVMH
ncbi:uncharacterized mitochondrial protein AtMg00810-like [Malania oleifera]|uniref:uncharacterized mitochondrial protein AtMg00810-like n=1 Tax=Malania oleifera TaxID=397392 RepID=UPI0025AEBEA8|nr:uncharacterized mitochondrial protein AtMg00810-like [Malania oleifera]